MAKLKVGILISGRGSNLQALIDGCADGSIPAEILLVASNRPGAFGLERAAKAGIPTTTIDHKEFSDRAPFEDALTAALEGAGAEFVCLAGFMRVLTDDFVEHWRDRMLNIHPSLLPSFRGLNTHQKAIDAGVKFTGCTVHFVRAGVDDGPILAQASVPVPPGIDADGLAAKILEAEHKIYPAALKAVAEGRVAIKNERVEISGGVAPDGFLLNPLS